MELKEAVAARYETEASETTRRLSSGEMEKLIGGLENMEKVQIGDFILNFGIGTLQAVQLAKNGQSLI